MEEVYEKVHDVLILGSGPAGLTAAIYAARANLNPVVIEGAQPGGQLMITTDVENFPGFPDGVAGPQLMDDFRKQAARFGTQFVFGHADRVELRNGAPFTVSIADKEVRGKTLIIATGASAKWLGLPEESLPPAGLYGRGLSACATCDGFFFRGKRVAVVGGGDTAMEEATFLARLASEVHVIHRRDELRASKAMQERAFRTPNITFHWSQVPVRIKDPAEGKVTGMVLKSTKSGELADLEVDGVFIAIGHKPNTDLFAGQLPMDANGYLIVSGGTRTEVPGVFAAGDVADPYYRQAITAAGMGCMAALEAERYIAASEG